MGYTSFGANYYLATIMCRVAVLLQKSVHYLENKKIVGSFAKTEYYKQQMVTERYNAMTKNSKMNGLRCWEQKWNVQIEPSDRIFFSRSDQISLKIVSSIIETKLNLNEKSCAEDFSFNKRERERGKSLKNRKSEQWEKDHETDNLRNRKEKRKVED